MRPNGRLRRGRDLIRYAFCHFSRSFLFSPCLRHLNMVHRHISVRESYTVLGLTEVCKSGSLYRVDSDVWWATGCLSGGCQKYLQTGMFLGLRSTAVLNAYLQLALKTHPDKNPGNADATVEFQRLSEAYNVLLKHLDRSASPPLRQQSRTYDAYADDERQYGFESEDEFHFDGDDEFDDYDDYESDDDYNERMEFYM